MDSLKRIFSRHSEVNRFHGSGGWGGRVAEEPFLVASPEDVFKDFFFFFFNDASTLRFPLRRQHWRASEEGHPVCKDPTFWDPSVGRHAGERLAVLNRGETKHSCTACFSQAFTVSAMAA